MSRIVNIILLDILLFPVGLVFTIFTSILMIFISMICVMADDYELIVIYVLSIPELLFPGHNIVDDELAEKKAKENIELYGGLEKTEKIIYSDIGIITSYWKIRKMYRNIHKKYKNFPIRYTFLPKENSDIGCMLENGIIYVNENTAVSATEECLARLLKVNDYNIETDKLVVKWR